MANLSANATEATALVPPVSWAQRRDKLIIIIEVENCQAPIVKFTDNSLYFRGAGGPDRKTFEITLELNGSILADDSTYKVQGRNVLCLLKKTESFTSYWPRLLKSPKRMHFLKTNFDLWRDEEDSDEDKDDMNDLDSDFKKLMNDAGDESGPPSDTDTDSDDEDLPDLG